MPVPTRLDWHVFKEPCYNFWMVAKERRLLRG